MFFRKPRNQTAELLTETYHLLKNPERWSQGAFALSKRGRSVAVNGGYAHSYCLIGGLRAKSGSLPILTYGKAVGLLIDEASVIDPEMEFKEDPTLREHSLTRFNDLHKHRHIKRILRRAIRKANKL